MGGGVISVRATGQRQGLAWLVERLVTKGIRPILAHAERSPELLHDPEAVEKLIRAGCLIQISGASM